MRNWKTTLGGILAALGTSLINLHDPAWLSIVGQILQASGLFLLGVTAKDFNVSGAGKDGNSNGKN